MAEFENIKRFDFDMLHDFSLGAPQLEEPQISDNTDHTAAMEEAPPPPPTFSESELQAAKMAAKQDGYNEGFLAGKQEADKEAVALNEALNEVAQQVVTNVAKLRGEYRHYLANQSPELANLVLKIAERVVGETVKQHPTSSIESMLQECLSLLIHQPKVNIITHPDIETPLQKLVKPLLAQSGFEGEYQTHTDPNMAIQDVRIEWSNGAAERDTETLWQQIEHIITQMELGQPAAIEVIENAVVTQDTSIAEVLEKNANVDEGITNVEHPEVEIMPNMNNAEAQDAGNNDEEHVDDIKAFETLKNEVETGEKREAEEAENNNIKPNQDEE